MLEYRYQQQLVDWLRLLRCDSQENVTQMDRVEASTKNTETTRRWRWLVMAAIVGHLASAACQWLAPVAVDF